MTTTLDLRNRLDDEFSDESDRGCAILTLCLLEECLSVLFSALLPGGLNDAKYFMPKGRLSLGITNAEKLGLLEKQTADSFRLLVEIRNTFAHGILSNTTFKTKPVRTKVSRLALPNLESVPDVLAEVNADPRRRFMMAVDNMFFTLNEIKNGVPRLKRHATPRLTITRTPRTAA